MSTVDHTHTINQILEKVREYNFEVNLAFVNFNKAFDTIYHDKIWESLAEQGTHPKYIQILVNLYSNANAYIKTDEKGREF